MNIGMVSTYPNIAKVHENMGGVASYTKNLIDGMNKQNDHKFFIFSNIIEDSKEKVKENQERVIRCWDEGKTAAFQIFLETIRYRKQIDVLHVQYEFFLYGGFLFSLLYPFLLLLYSVYRIPVITTIHQVPPIRNIGKEFLKENEISGNQFIFKSALFILLNLIVRGSLKTIVHEQYFKNILINQYYCNPNSVHVIPHGIEGNVPFINKHKAKEQLHHQDKKILLFFGYLSGYKGLDLLVDSFPHDNDNYYLIIAGGKHPRLKTNPSYLHYLDKLKSKAKKIGDNIEFTGFLDEKEIPIYFSAADLVIFPYLSHFSSSGPLSLTLAYEKPFIVSEVFKDQIEEKSLIFNLQKKDLESKIIEFFDNEKLFYKAMEYSKKLKLEWLWTTVGKKTLQLYQKVI